MINIISVAHAYNYFDIDPSGDLASSTLGIGGSVFADLSPIWTLLLGVGITVLLVSVVIYFIKHH